MIIVGVFFVFFYSFVFYDPVLKWGRLELRLILSFVFRSFNLNDVEYALNTRNIDEIKLEEQRMGFRLGFLFRCPLKISVWCGMERGKDG